MIVAQAPKADLLASVRKAARTPDEADSNAEVIEILYDFLAENEITARAAEFAPLTLAAGYSATYWANAVLSWGDRLLVINPDFRRSSGFYGDGLRFAISTAHERIRMLGSDYAEIELALLRFPTHKDAPRSIDLTVPTVELFSYDQLTSMTVETLSIWDQVCEERADLDRRKAANDDAGPLFAGLKAKGDGTGG